MWHHWLQLSAGTFEWNHHTGSKPFAADLVWLVYGLLEWELQCLGRNAGICAQFTYSAKAFEILMRVWDSSDPYAN